MTASVAQRTRIELRGAWQRLRPFLPVNWIMGCKESARERAAQPGCSTQTLRQGVRPVIMYFTAGNCRQPYVKGLTLMSISIYNGWRMEDVWLDR
jgi:hypothetical protein